MRPVRFKSARRRSHSRNESALERFRRRARTRLACEPLEDRLLLAATLPIYSTFDQDVWVGTVPATGGLNQPTAITAPTGGSVSVNTSYNGLASQPVVIADLGSANYGSVDYDFQPVTSGELRADVTVSLYSNSRSHLVDGYFLQIGDGTNVAARLRMSSSGQITDDAYHVLGNYQAGVPFQVRITVSPAEQTWSVIIDKEMDGFDNNSPFSGLLYSSDTVSRLSASLCTTVGDSATWIAYDNVKISTVSDLVVSEVRPVYYDSGLSQLEYQYTVKNIGDSPAYLEGATGADSDNVTIEGILSADAILGNADDVSAGTDILFGDRLGQLEAGQSVSGTLDVSAYAGTGRPYLFVRVDPNKQVAELNDETNGTDNNVTSARIPVAGQLPILSTFDHEPAGAPDTGGLNQPTSFTSPTIGAWVLVKDSSSGLTSRPAEIYGSGSLTYNFDNVWNGLLRIEATVSFDTLVASNFLYTTDFTNSTVVTRLQTNSGGIIYCTNAAGTTKEIGSYSPKTPFRVRLDIDLSARNWSFTQDPELDGFDDDAVETGLGFSSNAATQIDKVVAAFNGTGTSMAYDDIVVTRPDLVVSDLRPVAYTSDWIQYQYTVTNVGGAPANLNGIGARGNEVQRLVFDPGVTSGTYTISFNSDGSGGTPANTQTTGSISYNDTAATVQTRLAALSSIGNGNVQVSGSFTQGFTISFYGVSLGGRNLVDSVLQANTATLVGTTMPVTSSVETVTNGFAISYTLDDVMIDGALSSDTTYGNIDDVAIGEQSLVRASAIVLDPGESVTLLFESDSAAFFSVDTVAYPNFVMRVGCVADTSGNQATRMETDETNNSNYSVIPTGGPIDLSGALCQVVASTGLVWGQSFTVNYQVRNSDDGLSTADIEQLFILSSDAALSSVYTFDAVVLSDDISGRGTSPIRTATLTLPATAPAGFTDSGPFYLLMWTDLHDNAVETDETNNFPFSNGLEQDYDTLNIAAGPDLVGAGLTIPSELNWNQTFQVSCTVNDANGLTTGGTFQQAIYLSRDITFGNSDDLHLGSVAYSGAAIGTAQSGWIQMPSAAPAGYTTGPFYLYMVTDAQGTVGESNELNNRPALYGADSNSKSFALVSKDLRGAVCNVPSSLSWDQPFSLQYQIRNDGTTAVNTALVQRFYLSKDTVFGNIDDYSLGTATYSGGVPASGTGSLQTAQFQMPVSVGELQLQFIGVPNSGTYTLTFDLDGAGTTYAPLTTTALDFNATAPEIEIALESLITIGNDNVEVRGSYNNTLTFAFDLDTARSDMVLTVDTHALSSNTAAVTGAITSVFEGSGPFYIGMVTDDGMVYGGAVGESNEANNLPFSYAVGVDHDSFTLNTTLPDLQGSQCYPPVKIQWGESFLVSYQVTNYGDAGVTTDFTQSFYLSKDQVFGNADDVWLGSEVLTNDVAAPKTNEVQQFRFTATPDAGTYTLNVDFDGAGGVASLATVSLPYNATAAQLQTALENLGTIGAGNVVVTGSYDSYFEITFVGAFSGDNILDAAITASTGALTSGGAPVTGRINRLIDGQSTIDGEANNELQVLRFSATPDSGGYTLSFDLDGTGGVAAQTTANLPYDATAAQVQAALEALSAIGAGNVQVAGSYDGFFAITFIGDLAGRDVVDTALTVTGNGLTSSGSSVTGRVTALVDGAVHSEIQQLQFSATPDSGSYTLSFDLDGSGTDYAPQTTAALRFNATAAQVKAALEGLGAIGTGNIQVTGAYDDVLTITFVGSFAGKDVLDTALTVQTGELLLEGISVPGYVTTLTNGSSSEVQRLRFSATPDNGTYSLTFDFDGAGTAHDAQTTAALAFSATAAQVKAALESLSSVGAGNVEVKGSYNDGFTVSYLGRFSGKDMLDTVLAVNDGGLTAKSVSVAGTLTKLIDGGSARSPLLTVNLTLPASAPSGYSGDGPFFIGMLSDAKGEVWEGANESNNLPFSAGLGADWQFFYIGDGGDTPIGVEPSTPGLYHPSTSWFYLRDENVTGVADYSFGYGQAGANWTVLTGDWDGNGTTGVGLYNPATSTFYLTSEYQTGVAEYTFGYGEPGKGWIPIVGDWNGDGTDGVGLFDPLHSVFYLTDSLAYGYADHTFGYGDPGGNWEPMVGDWNGDGADGVGLYNQRTSTFYLTSAFASGYAEHTFGYGQPEDGWQPLVGDWDGDQADGVGLYNPKASMFYLTSAFATGYAQYTFGYGEPNAGWEPLVGDWNGDGSAGVGLYAPKSSTFYLTDSLRSGIAEYTIGFGQGGTGMVPFVGCWTNGYEAATVASTASDAPALVSAAAVDQIDLAGVAALQLADSAVTEKSFDTATNESDAALAIDLALADL